MIDRRDITGLVLAGGRGSRMGGVDKGLQTYNGTPLVLHAMQRLAPQVGPQLVNANRNLSDYAQFGVTVCPDADATFAGPLAGFLAGLQRCTTPYLMTVPCDSPLFPLDLVERLAAAIEADQADLAMPCTPGDSPTDAPQRQPVFCLMRASMLDSLVRFTEAGGRKIDRWTAQHRAAEVPFDDAVAFANANTLAELRDLETRHG